MKRRLLGAVFITATITACQSDPRRAAVVTAEAPSPPASPKLPAGARLASFPPRPADAEGGRAFLEKTAPMTATQREEAIYDEILRGNVPGHLRAMMPVKLVAAGKGHRIVTATAWVLPDYLAVGSDDDYVRVPINVFTATRLAETLGFALPTQKLVNAVYTQATVHLKPRPLPAGPEMTTSEYFQWHNDVIEDQLKEIDVNAGLFGELIAGHKKDVVMSNRLSRHPGRIAIYGWHKLDATPIQPLSLVHDAGYADYSHGVRFVDPVLRVNGQDMAIGEVLGDPELAALLSSEGRIIHYEELMHPGRIILGSVAH